MSRSIATTARLFGYRPGNYRRAAVAFVLVAGITLGVIGLRGHGKALAQAVPPAAYQPGLQPDPLSQFPKYDFIMTNMAYFYFATDGRTVVQFPSRPPLVLPPGEAEGLRQFAQQPPHLLKPQGIGQRVRYYINVGSVLYWENNDAGGATVHLLACPSLKLSADEMTHLRHAHRQLMQTVEEQLGALGAPPARGPERFVRPGTDPERDDRPGTSPVPPGAIAPGGP